MEKASDAPEGSLETELLFWVGEVFQYDIKATDMALAKTRDNDDVLGV